MKKVNYFLGLLSLLLFSTFCQALPFSIVPIGQLPAVYPATVRYDVQNATERTLTANLVKYLPLNVQVVTDISANACYPPTGFTLTSGQSCILTLSVTGPVNASDPDPRQHLVICANDKASCAGPIPTNSINVQTTLTSITVTPTNATIPLYTNKQYKAVGHYSNGMVADITRLVAWTSSNMAVATVGTSTGLATGWAVGSTTITARYGNVSGSTGLTVANPTLRSLTITPMNPSKPVGYHTQFIATGHYDNGTSADITTSVAWSSSNTAIATIGASTGLAVGVGQGIATITAAANNGVNNTATLTVTLATLNSITITPSAASLPQGLTQQYTAVGHYSDGSSFLITDLVTWTSSSSTVASINSTGLTTALREGTTSITATYGIRTSNTATLAVKSATLSSISILPPTVSMPAGFTQQYTAIGYYSNGTSFDITTQVMWGVTNGAVASISNTGLATAVSVGTSGITAAMGPVQAPQATLTVTAATLESITVSPATASIPSGNQQQYTATGLYSDGTMLNITGLVTWSSSLPVHASIDSTGLATGISAGATTITAILSPGTPGMATLNVTAATLVSISVTPASASIPVGLTQQFTATGRYSDQSTQNITTMVAWTTSLASVATVDSAGLATGLSDGGPITVTATLSPGMPGTAHLTVTSAVLESIAVTPSTNVDLPVGLTQPYTAVGTYSDSSTATLTDVVTWTSTNSNVAFINTQGMATGLTPGDTIIRAVLGGVLSNPVPLTVVPVATLTSIAITPADGAIRVNGTVPMTATGNYSDGSTVNLTTVVSWVSSAPQNATIIADTGVATGVSYGTTTISASYAAVEGATSLTTTEFAYVANSGNSTVSYCRVDATSGALSSCQSTGSGFVHSQAAAINPQTKNTLYVANNSFLQGVSACTINGDGSLVDCNSISPYVSQGFAIDSRGQYAYLTLDFPTEVLKCTINADGSFNPCTPTATEVPTDYVPSAIALNAQYAYLTYFAGAAGVVYICHVETNGDLDSCTPATHPPTSILLPGIALNPANSYVYITTDLTPPGGIYYCPIGGGGNFDACVFTGNTAQSYGIAVNVQYAYITRSVINDSSVYQCTINGNGSLPDDCPITGSGFSFPTAIVLAP